MSKRYEGCGRCGRFDARRTSQLSHAIHQEPELALEEFKSAAGSRMRLRRTICPLQREASA